MMAKLEKPCNPAGYAELDVPDGPPAESELLAQVGALLKSDKGVPLLVRATSLSRRQSVDFYHRGLWEGADGYACVVRGG